MQDLRSSLFQSCQGWRMGNTFAEKRRKRKATLNSTWKEKDLFWSNVNSKIHHKSPNVELDSFFGMKGCIFFQSLLHRFLTWPINWLPAVFNFKCSRSILLSQWLRVLNRIHPMFQLKSSFIQLSVYHLAEFTQRTIIWTHVHSTSSSFNQELKNAIPEQITRVTSTHWVCDYSRRVVL